MIKTIIAWVITLSVLSLILYGCLCLGEANQRAEQLEVKNNPYHVRVGNGWGADGWNCASYTHNNDAWTLRDTNNNVIVEIHASSGYCVEVWKR